MTRYREARLYLAKAAAVALCGGTMFASCETRLKDSVMGGVRQFILTAPAVLVGEALVPPQDDEDDLDAEDSDE